MICEEEIVKVKKSDYNYFVNMKDEYILFNTRTLSLVVLNEEEFSKYKQICGGKEYSDAFYNELYKAGFLIDNDLNEKEVLKYRLQKSRYSKEEMSLTIAPTMGCNFSCVYCYQRQGEEKNSGLMEERIQDAIINFVKVKLSGCKRLTVLWYGGEPLLGFEIIQKLSYKLMDICEKMNVKYEASIITNGYLLDRFSPYEFQKMKINDMQITLDGGKEAHDKRRMLKSKGGTFDRIIENIQKYNKFLNISVRINVDKENEKGIYQLINEFESRKIDKVSLYVAPVTNSENPNDPNCFKCQEFAGIFKKFEKRVENSGMKGSRKEIIGCSHYCDADFENAYVIDNIGDIYKCWSDIGNQTWCVGNILNEKQKNPHVYYTYMTYDPTEDNECTECKMLPLCMGGCPHYRVHNIDRCSTYRYILDDVILRKYSEKILSEDKEN